MRKLLLSLILITFGTLSLADEKAAPSATAHAQVQQQATPDESTLTSHGHYVNSNGQVVHSPSKSKSGEVPDGATARCGDGSYSFSKHHSGTCSHHGGVAAWL